MRFPLLYRVEQEFSDNSLDDIEGSVAREVEHAIPRIYGDRVAVAVGSRGIAHLSLVVRITVDVLRSYGKAPFIVPAMGTHGGGTLQGQRQVLESLGITEGTIGAPIICSISTLKLGETSEGYILYFDESAIKADGILLVNRVKPHTSFHGNVESGLCKMLVIGLGNAPGAEYVHSQGYALFPRLIPGLAREILYRTKVVGGLALIENGNGELGHVEFIGKENLVEREGQLLSMARASMPSLPFRDLDVLVIHEIGKCYSGTGMDTNIIGRYGIEGMEDPKEPSIRRIVALRLAEASDGNATGVGLADVITRRLFEDIDFHKTYKNVMATRCLKRGMIPIIARSDLDAISMAMALEKGEASSIAIIRNTLELGEVYVSENMLPQLPKVCGIIGQVPMVFDEEGTLISPK